MADAIRLHRARHRRDSGRTLIEGPTLFDEALTHGGRLVRVFALADDPTIGAASGVEVVVVTRPVLERLSTTTTPQSPVAVIEIPAPLPPGPGDLLVAWGVGDPGNVGALLRTAAAFGMGFVAGPGTADVWSPKVLRAATGAHFRAPVGFVADVEGLRGHPRRVLATVVAGGAVPSRPDDLPVAILVGDEANGLPAAVAAAADARVTIPMAAGTESLNAAVAGAIVAYAVSAGRAPGPH
ncbi:MAG TPA: RNA methyltransferase [Acidimicrobiia bacterium]|nr:RNA methyltransferase [Acidimicrobiia bacterium]